MTHIPIWVSMLLLVWAPVTSLAAGNFVLPVTAGSSHIVEGCDFNGTNCGAAGAFHTGIDYGSDDTDVYATSYGKVVLLRNGEGCSGCAGGGAECADLGKARGCCDHGFGNTIAIEHTLTTGKKIYSLYGHLQKFAEGLAEGSHVGPGCVIGTIGGTGYGCPDCYGRHLHFEIKDPPSEISGDDPRCPDLQELLRNPSGGTPCSGGTAPCWGYTPTSASNFGYYDPETFLVGRQQANEEYVIGGKLFSAGGEATVRVLPASSAYTSELYLFSPEPPRFIATNRNTDTIVRLGRFPIGGELVFGIFVRNTSQTFRMGPGSRNADGIEHAAVEALCPGVVNVGFEDLRGGGDRDYNDNMFQFQGGIAPRPGPDLAVDEASIAAFPVGSPDGIPVAGEKSTIKVRVGNVGTAAMPASLYTVAVSVWDVRGTGDLDTKQAGEIGRALLQFDSFQVAIPSLAPQDEFTLHLPGDGQNAPQMDGYLFSSTAYSDELQIEILPVFRNGPVADSNLLNNIGVLRPFRPALSSDVAWNCIDELWTVGSASLLNGSAIAETAAELVEVFYEGGIAMQLALHDLRDAVRSGDVSLTFHSLGKLLVQLGRTLLIAVGKGAGSLLLMVMDVGQAISNEWNHVGCAAVYPETKVLLSSLLNSMFQVLNSVGIKVFGFVVGSPVDVTVADAEGSRVTARFDGTVEVGIQGAAAFRNQEVGLDVIGVPGQGRYRVDVVGRDAGTARIGVVQPREDGSIAVLTYDGVQQQAGSLSTLEIDANSTDYLLRVDVDNDGTVERMLPPTSTEFLEPEAVAPLQIVTTDLPEPIAGESYAFQLRAAGGKPPYVFAIHEGVLPFGLGLLGTGYILGTASIEGDSTFTVTVEDLLGSTAEARLLLSARVPPTLTATPTVTPSPSQTPAFTVTETPSPTAAATATRTPTGTPTVTVTPSPTGTPTVTPSPTPSFTFTLTHTPTAMITQTLTPTPTAKCVGDCNGGGEVTVDEILTMVSIALGNGDVSSCWAGDSNADHGITVDEILTAVNNALNGCPSPAPTLGQSPPPTP
jgi:murein DD-endopeptidase MepM/ murein hydrolase activator NlpD